MGKSQNQAQPPNGRIIRTAHNNLEYSSHSGPYNLLSVYITADHLLVDFLMDVTSESSFSTPKSDVKCHLPTLHLWTTISSVCETPVILSHQSPTQPTTTNTFLSRISCANPPWGHDTNLKLQYKPWLYNTLEPLFKFPFVLGTHLWGCR